MSTSPFHHSDSRIAHAMPVVLAILDCQEERAIRADSEHDAADKCVSLHRRPAKLGRSHERRSAKMRGAIGVLINLGYVSFSPRTGLRLTGKGAMALNRRQASFAKKTSHQNGRQVLLPARA